MCASNRKSDGAYGINSIFTVSLIKKHCIDMFLKLKMRSLAIFYYHIHIHMDLMWYNFSLFILKNNKKKDNILLEKIDMTLLNTILKLCYIERLFTR